MKELFKNTSEQFILLESSKSHSQIVFRALRNRNRSYNIDIVFKAVSFIQSSTDFKGFTLFYCDVNSADYDIFEKKFGKLPLKGRLLFKIENTDGIPNFIIALAAGVFHSDVDILTSILGRYENGEFPEEEVLWFKG